MVSRARTRSPILLLFLLASLSPAATRVLYGPADVVRLAVGSTPVSSSRQEEAKARLYQRTRWPNPVVSWDRERIRVRGEAQGYHQQLVLVQQQVLDPARRKAHRRSGLREVDLARHEDRAERRREAIDALRSFLCALEAQEVQKELTAGAVIWPGRPTSARSASTNWSAESEGLRARQMLAEAKAQASSTRSVLAAELESPLPAAAELSALGLPLPPIGELLGDSLSDRLLAEVLGPVSSTGAQATQAAHPELALGAARLAHCEAEVSVAKAEGRIRWTLGGGYVGYDQSDLDPQGGHYVNVAIDLPLWDDGTASVRESRAQAEAAREELEQAQREHENKVVTRGKDLAAAAAAWSELLAGERPRVREAVRDATSPEHSGRATATPARARQYVSEFRVLCVRAWVRLLQARLALGDALGIEEALLVPGPEGNE
ncbi:MAG: TolC family protein [Candidatus Riflebacteria bacterium]|nr:TolC family protein [Candidatus Riflebacteria bacterium]